MTPANNGFVFLSAVALSTLVGVYAKSALVGAIVFNGLTYITFLTNAILDSINKRV
jgi:hypothetical protein